MILDALFPASRRLFAADAADRRPAPDDEFWYGPAGSLASSGIKVTQETALAISAVFACVRLLSSAVATIPQKVYQRLGEDRKRLAAEHPNYRLLHNRPNVWQVAAEYYELVMVHCLLRGKFFARIVMGSPGVIDQLVPLHSDRVQLEQLASGRLRFRYTPPMGPPQTLGQDQVHYIRGLSLDGVTGVSVLTYARNAIGLASAEEMHGAALFKNGSIPPFFLTTPNKMGGEAIKQFREHWRGMHGGAENAHNPPVFDNAMEAKALGVTNEDSQWIESRKFQAEEIARFFGVQPHKIALLDKATFSNIEHQSMEFVQDALMPWLVRIEQCELRDLFDEDEPFFPEFLAESRLRGDTKSRYEAYQIGIAARFLTPNEARARENLNPVDGGDEFAEPPGVTGMGGQRKEQEETEETEEEEDEQAAGSRRRAAFALLLGDAAARIARAEVRGLEARADKAGADRSRWNEWAAAFYDRHREYVADALHPLCRAWHQTAGGPQIHADDLARRWCRSSLDELADAPDVPALLAEWRQNLATSLQCHLQAGFFGPEP